MVEHVLKSYLDKYYDLLIEYKYTASRINKIFLAEIEKYSSEEAVFQTASTLILRDWSGKTDNGWAYAYPTDSIIYINKENHPEFVNNMLSKQFCLMYVQSFEGLEKLLRNFLFELAQIDVELRSIIEGKLKRGQVFSQKNIPDGDSLIEIINEIFDFFLYQKNKIQFDLKTSFYILSKTRHFIVHNNYLLSKSKIFCSIDKGNLFEELFNYNSIDKDTIELKLDAEGFRKLMDFMCEFAFQILKKSCLKYNLNWKLYKNMDKN